VSCFETYGFAAFAYASGAQFLGDDERRNAKCLIIDQHMPGIEWLELVAELQRRGVFLPTILVTVAVRSEYCSTCRGARQGS
jgi:two-component system response regulator FixJ